MERQVLILKKLTKIAFEFDPKWRVIINAENGESYEFLFNSLKEAEDYAEQCVKHPTFEELYGKSE